MCSSSFIQNHLQGKHAHAIAKKIKIGHVTFGQSAALVIHDDDRNEKKTKTKIEKEEEEVGER